MMMSRRTVRPRTSWAAMGRSAFSGCFRSSSRSIQSLKTYVPEDSRQNATKASSASDAAWPSKTRRAKRSGAKTARFFVHCRGRRARNQAGSLWVLRAAGAGSSGPSDAEVDEATLAHPCRVEDVATVEDHGLLHDLLHPVEIRAAELVPFGEHEESIGALQGLIRGFCVPDAIAEV